MGQKIKASIIIEIMGRPKEHIVETMDKFIEVMGKEKGLVISGKTLHEPKKVEHKDKEGKVIEVSEKLQLYTTFAEINIEVDTLMGFVTLCFKYMPAHVEIFEPAELKMNNFEINSMLNELMVRLHNYDAIAKAALNQNQVLTNKLREVLAGKGSAKVEETPEKNNEQAQPETNKKDKKSRK